MIDLKETIQEFEEKANCLLTDAFEYKTASRNINFDKELCLEAARKSKEEAEKCTQIADWLKELVRLRGDEENNGNEML